LVRNQILTLFLKYITVYCVYLYLTIWKFSLFFYLGGKKLTKTCLLKTAISSLNDSDEQTSPPATPGSRGVHVASSHFSNISASKGKRGCLKQRGYLCKQAPPYCVLYYLGSNRLFFQ
jgi:hypothetical protein